MRYSLVRINSRSALQGGGECPDHEAESVQDHGVEQVPGCDTVLEEGAGMEGWRPAGACFPLPGMQNACVL